MKKITFFLMILLMTLTGTLRCAADEVVDPILIDAPHPNVFSCKNDIFIELPVQPTLDKTASTRYTKNFFIEFKAEILFLLDEPWNGIDKTSFTLKHTDEDGTETVYPLNYSISMLSNLKNSWYTFAEPYEFADLRFTSLIFEVTPYTKDGWTFVFRPTERGSETPYCEVNIPLVFR